MTRPAENTKRSLVKAAADLFAEQGFERASVRDIVTKARVNQAAINYHFKGKDGFDPEKLRTLPRDEALRQFVHQQLRPLLFRDDVSRYVRMFAWESMHPTKVFRKFMATNSAPYLTTVIDLVRRFLPAGIQDRTALCGAIWLMGQCSIFVRNRELFSQQPFGITIDEPFVDELADLISRLAMGGLLHAMAAA